jgi:hypothetical protein
VQTFILFHVEQNITNVVAVAASDLAVLDFQLASLLPPFTQLNAVTFLVGCKKKPERVTG